MTTIMNSITLKSLIILKIICLLFNNTYAYGLDERKLKILNTKIENCQAELEKVFGTSNKDTEYFRCAILDLSKNDLSWWKNKFVSKYFNYLFSKIIKDTCFMRPSVFCQNYIDAEFEGEIKNANFMWESILNKEVFTPDELNPLNINKTIEKYKEIRRAEKLQLITNAFLNIGPNEYNGKIYLEAYMKYISSDKKNITEIYSNDHT